MATPRTAGVEPPGRSLSAQAHAAVSALIHRRQLKGGDVIVEARLADQLNVSRTPLREALQRLEGEGLVVKVANRSFMVRHVDLTEYLQCLKVRELLEPEAAANAVGRVSATSIDAVRAEIAALETLPNQHTDAHWMSDDNLHNLFLDHCGNQVMARMVRDLRVSTRLFEIAGLSARVEPDRVEHRALLEALIEGDARKTRRAMATHIRSLARHATSHLG
ncbi:MAG: GntR family transcriptional regulator [Pseudomonadota bacterium]